MMYAEYDRYAGVNVTNTKNMMVGDIQIDDRMKNLLGPTTTKILFTAYHNKNISDEELKQKNIHRVNNWKELVSFLESNN